jgi:hypothetical protein
MKIRIAVLAVVVAVGIMALAAGPRPAAEGNAPAAFAQLKGLVGTWQADTSMGQIQVTYELASGGNVLLERSSHGNMVTAYYLDGNQLVLTHYCELGNEPHMVARKIDLGRGEIAFDFAGAGNLASPDAPHMHSATFRLVDADHFSAAWTLFQDQRPKTTVTADYQRVK